MTIAHEPRKRIWPEGDTRQPELKGMPPKTKSHFRAEELLQAIDAVEDKKKVVRDREEALVQQMKADKVDKVKGRNPIGTPYAFELAQLEKLKRIKV